MHLYAYMPDFCRDCVTDTGNYTRGHVQILVLCPRQFLHVCVYTSIHTSTVFVFTNIVHAYLLQNVCACLCVQARTYTHVVLIIFEQLCVGACRCMRPVGVGWVPANKALLADGRVFKGMLPDLCRILVRLANMLLFGAASACTSDAVLEVWWCSSTKTRVVCNKLPGSRYVRCACVSVGGC